MDSKGIVNLGFLNLALAYGLVLLAIALARLQRIGQEGEMLWSSLRMVLQLLAVGYLLHGVFTVNSPLPVLLILLIMVGFSVQVMGSRVRRKMPGFYRVVCSSLIIGCGGVTFLFCSLVVGYTPWYDPRYLIPLAGMIIGNSMNGASLAAERLEAEIQERRDEIETAICLGATARQASSTSVRNAFRAALMPTVNTMAAMGIVSLPGMMTGQIIAGQDPSQAARYQIMIMFLIAAGTSLGTFSVVLLGYRRLFTPDHQFQPDRLRKVY